MAVTDMTVPDTSVDLERVSIITSTPADTVTDEPGRGSIYNAATLAAGRLFHVHRMGDSYLCSYATAWTAATAAADAPGQWSAKTVRARPVAWWINPMAEGSAIAATFGENTAPGDIYPQGAPDLRINSAASRRNLVVYLGSHRGGNFIAQYHATQGLTQFLGSNWCVPILNPAEQRIEWNRGVYAIGEFAFLVGASETGQLYMMKRRIGREPVPLSPGAWQLYLGERGWMTEPEDAVPMTDSSGAIMTSEGTVSLAHYRDVWLMSTVVQSGATYVARFYRANHPLRGWQRVEPITPVVFGANTLDPLLLGAHFQTAVTANPAYIAETPRASDRGGVPFTYTSETATELRTRWGVLTVPTDRL